MDQESPLVCFAMTGGTAKRRGTEMTTSSRKNTIIPTAALAAFLVIAPMTAHALTGAGALGGQDQVTAVEGRAAVATVQGDDWPWEVAQDDDWPWESRSS